MTAKPQLMAGNSEATDDLITELARLMAQDARTDKPSEPASPTFSVRIPGEETANATASPPPRFDNAGRTEPRMPASDAHDPSAPEPFHFDFGLKPAEHKAPAALQVSTPAPVPAPDPSASAPAAIMPGVSAPAAPPLDHDSIADLIAADLAAEEPPAPPSTPAIPDAPVSTAPADQADDDGLGWAPRMPSESPGERDRPSSSSVTRPEASSNRQDQFRVPPVFGLGTQPAKAAEPKAEPTIVKPEPAAPAAAAKVEPAGPPLPAGQARPAEAPPSAPNDVTVGTDAIGDIENLIGDAMRVQYRRDDAPHHPEERLIRATPTPALRSLATPTIPVESTPPAAPRNGHVSGVDEAILAAAASAGASIEWVEAPEGSAADTQDAAPLPRRSSALGMSRAIAGPVVALTLLVASGLGLYWVLGMGEPSGPAPLLTADATPVKEVPAAQPETPAAQSVVFNEIDGVDAGAEEQLVSRDQADVNEVTQDLVPSFSEEGLANRKVRTVTVRPDGTIVSGEDSVAGSAILPVDRPSVPEVPGAATASPELLASAQPVPETPPAPEPAATVVPVEPGATVPAVDTAGNPLLGKTAVIPLAKPTSFAQQVQPVEEPAALPAAELTVPAAPAIAVETPTAEPLAIPGATEVEALSNNAPAYVQLASQRSEADARSTAAALVTRYGPLFGGANMEVQRVDLGARGIYYRVRVPASSLAEADNICVNVKAAGGDCFTQ